jgi:hypothetical protein
VGEVLNSTLQTSSDADLQVWYEVGALGSILVTILVLVLLCAWRRCIARAIAIVQECTKVGPAHRPREDAPTAALTPPPSSRPDLLLRLRRISGRSSARCR